jgi:hypothetical protein
MRRRRSAKRRADTVTVERATLIELMAVAGATAHLHRFTRPPQMARADEIRDLIAAARAQAGLPADEVLPGYRVWFDEIAHYVQSGIDIPEGEEHFDRWTQEYLDRESEKAPGS